MTEGPVLEAREITVNFGGLMALDRVTLVVQRGTIHGLMGPNGAGKSTLFAVLSGLLRPGHGEVLLDGRAVTRARPQRRFALGLARTFQRPQLFRTLTVREHLIVARRAHRRTSSRRPTITPDRNERNSVDEVIDLLNLTAVADIPVALLALGTARLVEIARALAADPSVVLLDEPSSGLDSAETQTVAAALDRTRKERGTALLLVEHDVELLMTLCDHIDVLDFGQLIASGPPAAVRDDPAVTAAYLGVSA
jgi:ABC-type branched-subunit amino acid transport system ATPase component